MKKIYIVLFFLITIWTIISFARAIYNETKIFTEEKKWIFMSETKKREILYGDIYPLYNKINSITTSKDSVFLISEDGKPYFLLRYLLYPKKIYWFISFNKNLMNKKNVVIVFYHLKINENYRSSVIYSFGNGSQKSFVYKI